MFIALTVFRASERKAKTGFIPVAGKTFQTTNSLFQRKTAHIAWSRNPSQFVFRTVSENRTILLTYVISPVDFK